MLSPRGLLPRGDRVALAPRSTGDIGCVCVVQTMPAGNGLEAVADAVLSSLPQAELLRRRNFMVDDELERGRIVADFDAAILLVGPSTTILELSLRYASELERAGIPVALLVFDGLAQQLEYLRAQCPARLRIQVMPQARGATLSDAVAASLRSLAVAVEPHEAETGEFVRSDGDSALSGTAVKLARAFYDRGWTDGLPIELPTESAVDDMLGGTSHNPEQLVAAAFVPEGRTATVRQIAVNAVMAGAQRQHLPVILAAASLMSRPELEPMTRSVNSFAFAQLVSGPIATELGMNGGGGALSPGNRSNAVIGRSLQLMIRNLGGAREGFTISQTQGSAQAWALAMTENAAQSPWPLFHETLGHAREESILSLFSGGLTHLGNFYYDGLDEIGRALTAVDQYTGALVLLSAKRAEQLAGGGMSKAEVEGEIERHATVSLGKFRASGFYPMRRSAIERGAADTWPASYLTDPDDTVVAAFPRGSVRVAVVGSDASSTAQAWVLRLHGSTSIDAWR